MEPPKIIVPSQQDSVQGHSKKQKITAVIIILILVVAAGYFLWKTKKAGWFTRTGNHVSEELPKGYEFKTMPMAQYPPGFPQELVLSMDKVRILRAEDTVVATGQNYKIVELQTMDRPDSLAGLYRNTLTDAANGWQLVSSQAENGITTIAFKKNNEIFTVIIMAKGEGSQINLTYVNGQAQDASKH